MRRRRTREEERKRLDAEGEEEKKEEKELKNLCRNLRFRQLGALASGRKLNQEI